MCTYTEHLCPWDVQWVRNILHLAATFVLSHLSSHMYSLFGSCICFCKCLLKWQSQVFYIGSHNFSLISMITCLPCLEDIFIFFSFMLITFLNWTHVYLYTNLLGKKCYVTVTVFHIWQPHLFFKFCDHLGIPSFTDIFVFCKCLWSVVTFTNILHLATIFVLLHPWPLMASFFGRHIFFSFMPIAFEIVHKCIYTMFMP